MVKNVRLSDYQDVGLSKCWIMKMPAFSVSLSTPLCVHVPKPSHVVKQCRNLQLRTYVCECENPFAVHRARVQTHDAVI